MLNPNDNNPILPTRWPWYPASRALTGFGDASSMEQLLVHCAAAIEANDATRAQQILWVLNNIAHADGDSNQRLTCGFLRALILRSVRNGTCKDLADAVASSGTGRNICLLREAHRFSVVELAAFVDLTPWHRFGFAAANAAIVEAVQGYVAVHVVEIGLTRCMQIPTLIDDIANKSEVPPSMKLTVVVSSSLDDDVSPFLVDFSYEELGSKLVNFARSRNVNMEFRSVAASYADGFSSLIVDLRKQCLAQIRNRSGLNREALVINCQMMLHYVPEDQTLAPIPPLSILDVSSHRTRFLNALRSLDPTIVTLVDEDTDLTSNDVVTRLRSAFNHFWIPYDIADTILPKGSEQRRWYEAHIRWRIENVVAREGVKRVERLEGRCRWGERLRGANFRGVRLGEDAAAEVRSMLDEHATGWGMKKEEDDVVLTWKGHNVVFASAWLPS